MKVFVRTSELDGEKPRVLSFYADNISVPNNAHGDGVTVLTLPDGLVRKSRSGESRGYRLVEGWRARAGSLTIEAESLRRIDEAFSSADQVSALREVVDLMLTHGADTSKWPPEALTRKGEIDAKFNYIGEVRERARAHGTTMPNDPHSDFVWPTRIGRR